MDNIIDKLTQQEKNAATFIGILVMSIPFDRLQPLLIEALSGMTGETPSELNNKYIQSVLYADDLTENDKIDILTKIGEIGGH